MASKNDIIKETIILRKQLTDMYFNRFIDLLINSIIIEGLPADIPNDYVIKKLIEYGNIGVYKDTLWLPVNKFGTMNIYGVYDTYDLIAENGKLFYGKKENTKVIRFTPTQRSIKAWLMVKCYELATIDIAIRNNIENTSSPALILVDDKSNALSLKNEYLQKKIGVPVIFSTNNFANNYKVLDTGADFIVDKLQMARKDILNEVYAFMGIVAGNSDKKERVQSYDLPIDLAIDSIYVFIDTFNKDCEHFNIPVKMRLNGAIEELYNEDNMNDGTDSKNALNDDLDKKGGNISETN